MINMIPVFREGSLAPLNHNYVDSFTWSRVHPMDAYEVVPTEGLGDMKSCLQTLQIGQKMLFFCSPTQAANAARNAASYGMQMGTHKAVGGGIWIGRYK